MHFWIDKRSQTCGFSGRHRVPASLSAQHRRRRRPQGKPMVTPVHRFQPIDCVGGGGGRGRPGPHRHLNNYLPLSYSGLNSPSNLTARTTGAQVVELNSSVFLDVPLEGNTDTGPHNHQIQPQMLPVGRIRCGMWASFALATVFVAGAKFYFDHQGAGLEVLVFCSLLVVFLLAGCTVSLCRSKITRDLLSAAVTTSQPHHSTLTMQTPAQIMGPTPAPVVPEPPPPPYHIAVLLPHQNNAQQSTDDSPPPSYEKAIS